MTVLEKHFRQVIGIDVPELSWALATCCDLMPRNQDDFCFWFFENMETRLTYDWSFVLPKYFQHLQCRKFFVVDGTNHLRLRRSGFESAHRIWPYHVMHSILDARSTLALDLDSVQYHFTNLINNRTDSRYYLHDFLCRQQLLDQCHWSYSDGTGYHHFCTLNKWLGLRETDYQSLPRRSLPGPTCEQEMGLDDLQHHACSAITINTETTFHGSGPCYSGKIFKVMMSGRPFIEVSTAGTLADLHVLGFETFPDLIDESYDLIPDPLQRIQAICGEIQRISQIPLDRLRQYLGDHRSKFQHNFDRCQDLAQAIHRGDLGALIMPAFADMANVVDRDPPNH
jgi:hypothetical protein